MSSHLKAKELFLDALRVPAAERDAFLTSACDGDTALLADVRALLAFHSETDLEPEPTGPGPERFVPGDVFAGRYRMIELLGRAAMGDVWRADDLALTMPVALQLLGSVDSDGRERILNEVRLARHITHAAVRRVFDVGETGDEVFLSMELIEGEDLAALIKRVGRLPSERVLDIAYQLCDGLAAAHAHGLLHRDLKPANILIDQDGLIHITDFGIAVSGIGAVSPSRAGAPNYLAPEQRSPQAGAALSERTDLYSLGLVLHELLTGRHAFASSGESSAGSARPVRASQLVPGVDPALEAAITAALSRDPRDRPASAAAFKALLPAAGDVDAVRPGSQRVRGRERPWRAIAAVTAIVIVLAALGSIFLRQTPRALTDQDAIILADLSNMTGDPVFDGTLRQALAVALEQSPFFHILPDERVQDTLRLMGRPADVRLTSQLAREVAQREGLRALLTGSITSLGRNYVVALEALNADTGEVMARELVQAEGKEQVLSALGSVTSRLRETLGESLASVQRFNTPPERATTASLDALKAYTTALEHLRSGPSLEAIPFLTRALELDPDFALAYAQLSSVYTNTRQPGLAPPLSEKAFALRDRVSERERYVISWRYYRDATQDWEKALDVARSWTAAYPREGTAFNSLGLALLELGRTDAAIDTFNEARRIDPNFLTPYLNLGSTLTTLGRYEEAMEPLRYAAEHGSEGSTIARYLYALAFVRGDTATMTRLEAASANTLEDYAPFNWRGRREGFLGRVQSAHESYRQGTNIAAARGLSGPAAQMETEDAEIHAIAGQCDEARTETEAGLAFSRDNFTLERASRVLAWCGRFDDAAVLSRELVTRFPKATQTIHRWLPITTATVALRRGEPARALDVLKEVTALQVGAQFWPSYLRGLAYMQLRQFSEAHSQFQYIVDHRGQYVYSPLYPLAYLGLARVEVEAGNQPRAREAYDRFLTLWKDADQNLPQLVEARRERASLK